MVVSITRLRLKSIFAWPAFAWWTFRVQRQAHRAPGVLFVGTRSLGGGFYATMTAWNDETSLDRFQSSGAHGAVIRRASKLVDYLQSTRFEAETLPEWEHALRRLDKDAASVKLDLAGLTDE